MKIYKARYLKGKELLTGPKDLSRIPEAETEGCLIGEVCGFRDGFFHFLPPELPGKNKSSEVVSKDLKKKGGFLSSLETKSPF